MRSRTGFEPWTFGLSFGHPSDWAQALEVLAQNHHKDLKAKEFNSDCFYKMAHRHFYFRLLKCYKRLWTEISGRHRHPFHLFNELSPDLPSLIHAGLFPYTFMQVDVVMDPHTGHQMSRGIKCAAAPGLELQTFPFRNSSDWAIRPTHTSWLCWMWFVPNLHPGRLRDIFIIFLCS